MKRLNMLPILRHGYLLLSVQQHFADAAGSLAGVIYGPEASRAAAAEAFLTTTFPTLVECVLLIVIIF